MEILTEHVLNAHFNQQVSVLASEETDIMHVTIPRLCGRRLGCTPNQASNVVSTEHRLLPDCHAYTTALRFDVICRLYRACSLCSWVITYFCTSQDDVQIQTAL